MEVDVQCITEIQLINKSQHIMYFYHFSIWSSKRKSINTSTITIHEYEFLERFKQRTHFRLLTLTNLYWHDMVTGQN